MQTYPVANFEQYLALAFQPPGFVGEGRRTSLEHVSWFLIVKSLSSILLELSGKAYPVSRRKNTSQKCEWLIPSKIFLHISVSLPCPRLFFTFSHFHIQNHPLPKNLSVFSPKKVGTMSQHQNNKINI